MEMMAKCALRDTERILTLAIAPERRYKGTQQPRPDKGSLQKLTVSRMSVPYIGAKISLTSRSLIRYEGVLARVDPKEATISLERGTG
ncbi:LSM14-like protein A, partial [Paramicrosporidium saccamoebae]